MSDMEIDLTDRSSIHGIPDGTEGKTSILHPVIVTKVPFGTLTAVA